MDRTPSYYAVIPASVRYDPELRPNAKLIYGELSALAAAEGYCWATNAYFAQLFGLSGKTVAELIRQLAERGHIAVEVVRDPETQEVQARKIWIAGPTGADVTPSPEKSGEGSPEKSGDPPPKNREENNTSNNITSHNNTPQPPTGGGARAKRSRQDGPKSAPDWKPERFAKFWAYYPRGENKQRAIRAWDKLRPSDELIDTMARALARQMESEEWQRGIGIPHASTWINGRRWEDEVRRPAAHAETAPSLTPERFGWD